MIIVDTSIWIDYFNKNEIIFNHMLRLLERGEVYTIDCIFGELLQGCRTNKGILQLLTYNLRKGYMDNGGGIFL